MNCEIIAIGSELLTPFRQDTNSLYLTAQLNRLGVTVAFKTIVGDRRQHLVDAARVALSRADLIIFSGGLGPTEDDLTRECVAEALGIALHRDSSLIAAIEARFAARGIAMSPNNLRQTEVLDGAETLPNTRGTAPGQFLRATFRVKKNGKRSESNGESGEPSGERGESNGESNGESKILILLPGPPREIKPMFDQQCIPRLRAALPIRHIATRMLRMALIPESTADALASPIYNEYPDVETTILAHYGEIQLHFLCSSDSLAQAQARVDELADKVELALEEFVFSSQGESLEEIVVLRLGLRGLTLSIAESCTGGMLAQRVTSVSGSSRSFLGGAVVYSNELKTLFAGVPPSLIAQHGAVSREVAIALAEGIRSRTGSSLGVGITGIAGPAGAVPANPATGAPEKPVGLIYIALADGAAAPSAAGTEAVELRLSGDRDNIRFYATQKALDLIRRKLM